MQDNQLRNIQLILVEGLVEIDRLCKSNNIPYFMISGTLLGAIRHKGFIPWDTDIDVGMLRSDYETFVKKCKNELNPKFTLQHPETDENSTVCFTRIRINGTKLVSKTNHGKNHQESLYVDVYPLDSTPEIVDFKERFKEKIIKVLWRILAFRNGDIATKNLSRQLILKFLKLVSLPLSNRTINRLLSKSMTAYKNSNSLYVTNYASHYGSMKERQLKSDFGTPIDIEFEGFLFSAPQNCKKVLHNLYGNYMELPPIDKRRSLNFEEFVIDLSAYQNDKASSYE